MMKFLWTLFQFVLGLVLLFLTVGIGWMLCAFPVKFPAATILWPFAISFAAGACFFLFISRIQLLYVFGHELTHWFTAKLFLRETGPLNVGSEGGSVAIQKPNIWITLAPYFVPFYTLLWLACYAVFRFAYGPPNDMALRVLWCGIGLSYAYHVIMTLYSLIREQSDLRTNGYFFSLALILFVNSVVIAMTIISLGGNWDSAFELLKKKLDMEFSGITTVCEKTYEGIQTAVNWIRDTLF